LASLVLQFLGTAVLFYLAYYVWGEPLEEAGALAFMQATMQELVVLCNCRSETKNAFRVGFTNNRDLLLAVLFSAAITVIIPYTVILFGVQLFGSAPPCLTGLGYNHTDLLERLPPDAAGAEGLQ
jgi:magnesium-transporting ATPase (P-type)